MNNPNDLSQPFADTVVDSATSNRTSTNDLQATPRSDKANCCHRDSNEGYNNLLNLSRQLERELAQKTAQLEAIKAMSFSEVEAELREENAQLKQEVAWLRDTALHHYSVELPESPTPKAEQAK